MVAFGDRILLFGGHASNGIDLGDAWEWDGNTWTPSSVRGAMGSAPAAREGHAMASLAGGVVLFGGLNVNMPSSSGTFPGYFGDTWEWDGGVWSQSTVSGPAPRFEAAMASLSDGAVLFGGSACVPATAETWQWDGAGWTQRPVSGPSARSGHAMTSR
jgi:hypothetical protein